MCQRRKKTFSLLSIFSRLGIDFKFADSDPHWARQNLVSYVLCARVNMCKCVCVCAPACLWIWQWGRTTRDFESPPIIKKFWGVIGHSMSTSFIILINICMKTGSWTRDGFEDLVMHGKVLSTPRYLSADGYLPLCAIVCV